MVIGALLFIVGQSVNSFMCLLRQCGNNYQNLEYAYLLAQQVNYPRFSQHICLHMYTKAHRAVNFLACVYIQIFTGFYSNMICCWKIQKKYPAAGGGINHGSAMQCDTLTCLGCYDKILQIGQLINNRNFFLIVLKAGSPRSACQHGQVRALFQVADFLLYVHMAEGAQDLCGVFLFF